MLQDRLDLGVAGVARVLEQDLCRLGLLGRGAHRPLLPDVLDQGGPARGGGGRGGAAGGGPGPRAPLLDITDEQWHAGLDVYFLNVVRAVRLVAPIMVAQKAGAIVNISTAWVAEPSAMFPTSAVARAGLAAFTKLFADAHAADNVRMNNVLPGWIDSLPLRRYGTADEIAATVAFLASEGAGYITGQSLRVDGGLMRSV